MKEDMLEVLMYLFENYIIESAIFEPGQVNDEEQSELADELIGAGFPSEEIEKAFV